MYRARVIPTLLIQNDGVYKTIKFKNPRYCGDPINIVKIFNEKEVDEIFLFDILASKNGTNPNYALIEEFSQECFMPVCYGGGISSLDQVKKIFDLGIEKICIGLSFWKNPELVYESAKIYGSQSLAVCMDIKKGLGGYKLTCHNGHFFPKKSIKDSIKFIESNGAGEIIVNDISRDGTMMGVDINLASDVSSLSSIPVVISGGVGSFENIKEIFSKTLVSGLAVGSYFIFYGKDHSVLVNYLKPSEMDQLLQLDKKDLKNEQPDCITMV